MSRDGAGGFLAGHNSLLNATGEITVDITVAFVNDTLESCALPTHDEIAVIHRASSVAVRETTRENGEWPLDKARNFTTYTNGCLGFLAWLALLLKLAVS